ncbi:MAG TPA: NAD(P)/FAD-dependent oxidoreductase [Gemmatimonadaceae bacterium]|nr:NAD(P)/FAD-dependent oxidoreductase [Gemmatimonadaceae bacterium]
MRDTGRDPHSTTEHVRVVVIGGGPAGLATSRELGARGVEHVVLERGDVAAYTWTHLYDSLTLHTGKHLSGLPGLKLPRATPLFPPRAEFVAYLQDYARRFAVPLRTNWPVARVTRQGSGWRVEGERGVQTCDAVVIATGIVANPRIPEFAQREQFRGRVMHSRGYLRPGPFAGQRVLVVGVGNSGGEIASELARTGVRVTVAVRSGANVVPRAIAGIPVQYIARQVRRLPRPVQRVVVAAVAKLGELRRGPPVLPRPAHSALEAIPLIGFHLVDAIRDGSVAVRPGVAAFTTDGVRFTNGVEESFDTVILATGFAPALAPLGELVQTDAKGFALRTDRVTSANQPNLYFVGHNYDAAGGLYNIATDAPLVADRIVATFAGQVA